MTTFRNSVTSLTTAMVVFLGCGQATIPRKVIGIGLSRAQLVASFSQPDNGAFQFEARRDGNGETVIGHSSKDPSAILRILGPADDVEAVILVFMPSARDKEAGVPMICLMEHLFPAWTEEQFADWRQLAVLKAEAKQGDYVSTTDGEIEVLINREAGLETIMVGRRAPEGSIAD